MNKASQDETARNWGCRGHALPRWRSARCGGGGAPVTANAVAARSTAGSDYTGPAPRPPTSRPSRSISGTTCAATNRCGAVPQRDLAGQMPNFARNDDVNLAYTQANTVVNLTDPGSRASLPRWRAATIAGLADPSACGAILTTWITNWAGAPRAAARRFSSTAPADQRCRREQEFPGRFRGVSEHRLSAADPVLLRLPRASAHPAVAVLCSRRWSTPPTRRAVEDQSGQPGGVPPGGAPAQRIPQLLDGNCAATSQRWRTRSRRLPDQVPVTQVDPALVISKALTMYDGTVASGGSRYESNADRASGSSRPATGTIAFDTSGVEPAVNLTLSGDVNWVGGWGIEHRCGGKAQGSTPASKKLHDLITPPASTRSRPGWRRPT